MLVCSIRRFSLLQAAQPLTSNMGNACGSNVKDKLEARKLYLHVQGFPKDGAPAGDLDSPFGVDFAIPVRRLRADCSITFTSSHHSPAFFLHLSDFTGCPDESCVRNLAC